MDILINSNGKNPATLTNGIVDLSSYSEPTRSILQFAFDAGDYVELIDAIPEPIVLTPDWEGLTNHILGGELNSIYTRLTVACFVNPITATLSEIGNANNIAVASGKLDQAVALTRVEGAVAASFQLLINTSNYRFTQEEKALWDSKIDELNFSPLVSLP